MAIVDTITSVLGIIMYYGKVYLSFALLYTLFKLATGAGGESVGAWDRLKNRIRNNRNEGPMPPSLGEQRQATTPAASKDVGLVPGVSVDVRHRWDPTRRYYSVTWRARPAEEQVTGYEVERRMAGGRSIAHLRAGRTSIGVSGAAHFEDDGGQKPFARDPATTANPDSLYQYRVRAINRRGEEGEWSIWSTPADGQATTPTAQEAPTGGQVPPQPTAGRPPVAERPQPPLNVRDSWVSDQPPRIRVTWNAARETPDRAFFEIQRASTDHRDAGGSLPDEARFTRTEAAPPLSVSARVTEFTDDRNLVRATGTYQYRIRTWASREGPVSDWAYSEHQEQMPAEHAAGAEPVPGAGEIKVRVLEWDESEPRRGVKAKLEAVAKKTLDFEDVIRDYRQYQQQFEGLFDGTNIGEVKGATVHYSVRDESVADLQTDRNGFATLTHQAEGEPIEFTASKGGEQTGVAMYEGDKLNLLPSAPAVFGVDRSSREESPDTGIERRFTLAPGKEGKKVLVLVRKNVQVASHDPLVLPMVEPRPHKVQNQAPFGVQHPGKRGMGAGDYDFLVVKKLTPPIEVPTYYLLFLARQSAVGWELAPPPEAKMKISTRGVEGSVRPAFGRCHLRSDQAHSWKASPEEDRILLEPSPLNTLTDTRYRLYCILLSKDDPRIATNREILKHLYNEQEPGKEFIIDYNYIEFDHSGNAMSHRLLPPARSKALAKHGDKLRKEFLHLLEDLESRYGNKVKSRSLWWTEDKLRKSLFRLWVVANSTLGPVENLTKQKMGGDIDKILEAMRLLDYAVWRYVVVDEEKQPGRARLKAFLEKELRENIGPANAKRKLAYLEQQDFEKDEKWVHCKTRTVKDLTSSLRELHTFLFPEQQR